MTRRAGNSLAAIDRGTTRALGLAVPQSILMRADRIVE
jgi:hypothetical protein